LFCKELVTYASQNNADLILVDATRKLSFSDILFGIEESYVIGNNARIPVICVNSEKTPLN